MDLIGMWVDGKTERKSPVGGYSLHFQGFILEVTGQFYKIHVTKCYILSAYLTMSQIVALEESKRDRPITVHSSELKIMPETCDIATMDQLSTLIDLALSTKDKEWFDKLMRQKRMLDRINEVANELSR